MSKAIIRIKRSLTEDPINTLVLNCKKRKVDDSSTSSPTDSATTDSDSLSTIFKFAGTVENASDVFQHLKLNTKAEAESKFKSNHVDVIKKLRTEQQENSKNNRYKIVNHFRSLDVDESVTSPEIGCTVVDVVASENEDQESTADMSKFVYDYYYTSSESMFDEAMYNYLSVCPLSNDGLEAFETYNVDESEDSEDSNAENYFKNDYPDESEDEQESPNSSSTDDDLMKAMHKASLHRDLSTDDSDGDVYGDPRTVALDHSYYDDYDDSITP